MHTQFQTHTIVRSHTHAHTHINTHVLKDSNWRHIFMPSNALTLVPKFKVQFLRDVANKGGRAVCERPGATYKMRTFRKNWVPWGETAPSVAPRTEPLTSCSQNAWVGPTQVVSIILCQKWESVQPEVIPNSGCSTGSDSQFRPFNRE